LSDQSADELRKELNSRVVSHFIVYKTFAKTLAAYPGSTYTFITGGIVDAFEEGQPMFKDSSFLIIGATGATGVYNAAFAEFFNHANLRVSQLRIRANIQNKLDSELDKANDYQIGNDFVAKFIIKIIARHAQGIVKISSRTEGQKAFDRL
jgi:hypothetical protein